MELIRCPWCIGDYEYTRYHDEEWGIALKDNLALFELLVLEEAQAGLSWKTILHRRAAYRQVFDAMNPEKIARYTNADITRLMRDTRIIRNRRKIIAAINNAQKFLAFAEGPVSFSDWLWNWVNGEQIVNHYRTVTEIPASTSLSEQISAALKKRGFTFIGPTIIYAFMQAAGLVNDHLVDCFRHPSLLLHD
ncbi:MAG: DNA-3-methyladenine glycosylase I [Spirochaetaceae bacterium]|jgi:DNA-3-methyladenine glycosylase I|nr:DNA-3-methyladenine glycosylase I [Spirochaetaceae bacterium]